MPAQLQKTVILNHTPDESEPPKPNVLLLCARSSARNNLAAFFEVFGGEKQSVENIRVLQIYMLILSIPQIFALIQILTVQG
jgi:hypothetical protein